MAAKPPITAAKALGRRAGPLARGLALAARAMGRRAVAAATSDPGRRLARAATLTLALAVLVTALYDRGEVPTAAAHPAANQVTAGGGAAGKAGKAGTGRRPGPDGHGGMRGRTRPATVGERPAEVAAAWYATRHGLPRARVKPLQQDRVSATEARVLVLADPGNGRLRTALVRVRRTPTGWRAR
jgi:hypothetical protein